MPVQNRSTIQSEQDFITRVRNILQQLEGRRADPYFDSAGIITIGIGINIDLQANRQYVLGTTMGLNPTALDAAWNSATMAAIKAMPQNGTGAQLAVQLAAKNQALRNFLNAELGRP